MPSIDDDDEDDLEQLGDLDDVTDDEDEGNERPGDEGGQEGVEGEAEDGTEDEGEGQGQPGRVEPQLNSRQRRSQGHWQARERELAETRRRAEEAEARAAQLAAERQRDEAQRQRAAQEQREQQRQLMTPEERNAADIQAIAAQVNFQRDMDAFYRNDASDKAQYDAKVHAGDKVYKRHQKAVEAELKRCRDRGFNVPREELLYREIGKEALNVAEQSTRSTATRRKPVSKPSNSRGDATSTPGKRGPSSDKEALRKRLENMPL